MASHFSPAGCRPLLAVAALLVAVCLPVAAADGPRPIPHLRFVDVRLAPMVRDGCRRSPTFRALVDHLEQSDVVVYVETVSTAPPLTKAYMRWTGTTATLRLVRVSVKIPASTEKIIELLGHELQHANEVANAPEVRSEGALAALYLRIGDATPSGVDTPAARLAGVTVRNELDHALSTPAVADAAAPAQSIGSFGQRVSGRVRPAAPGLKPRGRTNDRP